VKKMGESVCFCHQRPGEMLPPGVARGSGNSAAAGFWELCALSPEWARELTHRVLRCRTLLVPEGTYCPTWQAQQVVSYGLSGRSSLTLSSMDGQGVLCVQRTLQDRRGQFIEAQELPLPEDWRDQPPLEKLMLAGVWLLWRGLPFSN